MLEVLEMPEVIRCALLCMLEVLEVPEVPEAMRCVLLCMLEAVDGRLYLPEVSSVVSFCRRCWRWWRCRRRHAACHSVC